MFFVFLLRFVQKKSMGYLAYLNMMKIVAYIVRRKKKEETTENTQSFAATITKKWTLRHKIIISLSRR